MIVLKKKNSLRFPFRARRMQRVQSVNSEKRYPKRRVCSLQRAIVSYFWSRVQPREETKEKWKWGKRKEQVEQDDSRRASNKRTDICRQEDKDEE